jgi:tetratricopeptide (TPR) repeat protein
MGRLDLALPLYEETLKHTRARLGPDHLATLRSMNNLAAAYKHAGKLDRAVPLFEETVRLSKAKLGADHPATLTGMNNLAWGYQGAGKPELALPLYEETLKLRTAKLGPDHPDTLVSMNNLGRALLAVGKLDLALPLLEETLKLRKGKLGRDHPNTLLSAHNLALGYQTAGKMDRALPLFEEAAAGIERRDFQHEHADPIVTSLIACYEQLRQFGQAEVSRRKWLAVVKERSGADSVAYASELAALGRNLFEQKKSSEAETALRESLPVLEKRQPDDWLTFDTQSMLGAAVLSQKKYAEAEPLLRKGYEGMQKRAAMIPPHWRLFRLTDAAERLVRLYDALEKKDEAAKWRNELAALRKPPKVGGR